MKPVKKEFETKSSLLRQKAESAIASNKSKLKYLRIIEISGAQMLNIINNIIDISKIESGLMLVSKTITNVNEQIEFIYSFFKETVTQKGLQLRYKKALREKESFIHTDCESGSVFYFTLPNDKAPIKDAVNATTSLANNNKEFY